MSAVAPHDEHAERALLGAVLMVGSIVPKLSIDVGLRPEHFYRPPNAAIFAAAVKVSDAGAQPDPVTVCDALDQAGALGDQVSKEYVNALPTTVPSVHNAPAYAQTVVELAALRRIQQGAYEILAGVDTRDLAQIEQGENMLARRDEADQRTATPEQLASEIFDRLDSGPDETFPWPFYRLNELTNNGMRRGQLTLVAGWSSHGKSVVIDQTLEAGAREGLSVHLYINEMTRAQRTQRTIARLAEVSLQKIATSKLTVTDKQRIVQVLPKIAFGITDCAGWTAADVARDVRRRGYDLVGIDIVNRFPGGNDREELEEISRILNELTKPSQANCHLLLGAHLNRNRASGQLVLPFPSPADLRSSAMLYNDADNCLFVHRDQDEDTGEPMATGILRFAKARDGRQGGLQVTFLGKYMRFQDRPLGVAGKDRAAA